MAEKPEAASAPASAPSDARRRLLQGITEQGGGVFDGETIGRAEAQALLSCATWLNARPSDNFFMLPLSLMRLVLKARQGIGI